MRNPLIIGTRGSDLALWQANFIKNLLKKAGLDAELKIIKTKGDEIQHLSLDKLEGKGFFTKEIEDALIAGETDLAVHSHKDLPTESPEELVIAAVSEREDPSEIILIRKECVDVKQKFSVKQNAIFGTSSARRKAQLLAFRPDLQLRDLRGNVPTRVAKLRNQEYDAIMLAAAGVERLELDLSEFHVVKLDPREFIPAPAQGILAIQIRKADKELFQKLQTLNYPAARLVTEIERGVLSIFHGGCQMPVGVFAEYDEDREVYMVRASKAESWDAMPVSVYSESKEPEGLAQRVVDKINQIKPARVFITRDTSADHVFKRVLEAKGFSVDGKSLIETLPVKFSSFPDCNWIFFSSQKAVRYFFQQKPELGQQRFACVGKTTSEELRKYGHRAEFIGSSTDTKLIGKQFAAKAGNDIVLFPQAKGSMRSVQQQFIRPNQVIDLIVYETLKQNTGSQPEAEILLFTSPSNVEAWFESFRISKMQKIIAMGDATANALRQSGVSLMSKPDTFDDAGLIRAVFNASSNI